MQKKLLWMLFYLSMSLYSQGNNLVIKKKQVLFKRLMSLK